MAFIALIDNAFQNRNDVLWLGPNILALVEEVLDFTAYLGLSLDLKLDKVIHFKRSETALLN